MVNVRKINSGRRKRKLVIGERGSGKTTDLVKRYIEEKEEAIIIVSNQPMKRMVEEIAIEMGYEIRPNKIFTFYDLIENRVRGFRIGTKVYMDNVEYFIDGVLKRFSAGNLDLSHITMSHENVEQDGELLIYDIFC